VALQDGFWDHESSYAPKRANRADTVRLWHKIETKEDPEWTLRYHTLDTDKKAFGARIEIFFKDGTTLIDEMAVANAHPLGAKPFVLADYIHKFQKITNGIISTRESNRFLEAAQNLSKLGKGELAQLNVALPAGALKESKAGIF
jgi:2-methylcitrate dehydratase